MYTGGARGGGERSAIERSANGRENRRRRNTTWVSVEGDDLVQRQVEGLLRTELDGHHCSGDREGRPGQHRLRNLGLEEELSKDEVRHLRAIDVSEEESAHCVREARRTRTLTNCTDSRDANMDWAANA